MASYLAPVNELLAAHSALTGAVRASQKRRRRMLHTMASPPQELLSLPNLPSPPPSPPASPLSSPTLPAKPLRQDLPAAKRARAARYANYVPEEETIRNDYSQRYVDGGEWPQNWVLGAEPEHRFEEYPKQQRLLMLKKASVAQCAHVPAHLPLSSLTTLNPSKFDVILIDPPFSSTTTWDTLSQLPIPSLAADPSFVFLWVGSGAGDGLERGRDLLAKWGYRRCEDVCWVKTNKNSNRGPGLDPPTTSLLTRTKQHCLMGIRGTVRRSTDSWFVHCNVDTDVIIWEGDPTDPTRKPPEMYTLIENFCLGTRRLEIFGRPHSLRRGWITAGDFTLTPEELQEKGVRVWEREWWEAAVRTDGKTVVPTSAEIDALRPKSPVRNDRNPNNNLNPNVANQPRPNQLPGFPANPPMAMPLPQHPQPFQMGGMPMAMGPPMTLPQQAFVGGGGFPGNMGFVGGWGGGMMQAPGMGMMQMGGMMPQQQQPFGMMWNGGDQQMMGGMGMMGGWDPTNGPAGWHGGGFSQG